MELLREQDVFKISAEEKKNNRLPRRHLLVAPNCKSISAVSSMTAERSVVQEQPPANPAGQLHSEISDLSDPSRTDPV